MNPVLFAPVSPCAPAITPNYTALLCNPEFKNVIKSLVITLANEDIDFRESLKDVFDYHMATSELRVLKRLSVVETDLGHNDLTDFEEEHVPTIPEQIKTLSDRLEHPLSNATDHIKTDVDIIPQTITEHRANELITHLKNDIAPRNSEVFLTSREIMIFLKDGIKEEYRIKKDVVNLRQTKKDVLKKAVEMFTTSVSLSKKSNGHKEVRIILRKPA